MDDENQTPAPDTDAILESVHTFPGPYQIKAIGSSAGEFEARILRAVRSELARDEDLDWSVRTTPGGRHIAVTLRLTVQSPEQVRAIYAAIRGVEGLSLLL
jgi:putative lipoic acid-binding regulatory protein